jgi:NAD(P)-dependent dehydrogenase (short-subunit alcohol dehydrogenase family)
MPAAQRVLVFGAGDSVGRLTAERYAAIGARVHICDVDEKAVASTLAANPTLTGTTGSVGIRGDVDRAAREAVAAMGGIDVMANFVGIAGPRAPVEDISDEDWQTSMQVNLAGAFYAMCAVIPGMKRQRSGAIVNISSASTRTGIPERAPYVVSKCAIEGLVRNTARELGPFNVRCNAVLPGALKNARMDFVIQRVAKARGITPEAFEAEMLKYTSMRTRIGLDEVANMVMFLCSDLAPHVTGQLIEVSGGLEWEE